jgi:hypothetical protein
MAGLVPAIHVFLLVMDQDMDAWQPRQVYSVCEKQTCYARA